METPEEPPTAHILSLIQKPAPDTAGDSLPEWDSPYRPHAAPSAQERKMVCFLFGNQSATALPYAHLCRMTYRPAEAPATDESITLRFSGIKPTTFLVEGRNLWGLLDWIGRHRMAWLREWPQAREEAEGMPP